DATLSMPPYGLWFRGPGDIRAWMLGPGAECEGSRLIPTEANGSLGFGQYRRAADGDGHTARGLDVLDGRGGKIAGICGFLDAARGFPRRGVRARLPPCGRLRRAALGRVVPREDAVQAQPCQHLPQLPAGVADAERAAEATGRQPQPRERLQGRGAGRSQAG